MISSSHSLRKVHLLSINSIFTLTHSISAHSSSTSFFSTIPSSLFPHQNSVTPFRLNHKDWLTPNEVLKIVETISDPNSLVSVLDQYSKRKDYRPNEAFFTLVISKLAQARMFDAIEDVMQRIKTERNCRLSGEFFFHVIKVYGNVAGRIGKAIETLFDMPNYNCWPNVKTFNFVLNLLVSAKLFDVVHEVYLGAPKLGIEIDACCLNILIKGLCESGNLDAAFYLLDEFPKQRCEPNVKTFSTLMNALCENGDVDKSFELLERMETEGICPDTITFNILISGRRKQGRVEEAMGLLERMKLKGCYPNGGSYHEVLYGLLDSNKYKEGRDLMQLMIMEGIDPSFVSYKKMITGLCKANLLEDVDWVLKQMVHQGFVPKMGMWRVIVHTVLSGKSIYSSVSCQKLVEN